VIRHLLVPGLFEPLISVDGGQVLPRLPALELVTARADRLSGPRDFIAAGFELFGIQKEGEELPSAAVSYALVAGEAPEGWIIHADPVHLRADRDRLLLFDGRGLGITEAEAAACVAAFNSHFSGDGLVLRAPDPGRWYLMLDTPPGVKTTPLSEVTGRNINAYLPAGERHSYWHHLLNEVQMLFHGLPLNQARESSGQLPISGLWFSGGGRMPARGTTTIRQRIGSDVLIDALAAYSDNRGDDELWIEMGPWRAVLEADLRARIDALQGLDNLIAGWLAQEIECRVYPCNRSTYHWRPGYRWRLWRRLRPLWRPPGG
jgi:hypothetical protein